MRSNGTEDQCKRPRQQTRSACPQEYWRFAKVRTFALPPRMPRLLACRELESQTSRYHHPCPYMEEVWTQKFVTRRITREVLHPGPRGGVHDCTTALFQHQRD